MRVFLASCVLAGEIIRFRSGLGDLGEERRGDGENGEVRRAAAHRKVCERALLRSCGKGDVPGVDIKQRVPGRKAEHLRDVDRV
jgi:hypothetical protein